MRALPVALEEMTEKQFSQQQLYPLIEMLGWHRYHTFRSQHSPPGWPDEALVRERLVFLEVKTEKGKLTDKQREWVGWLDAGGAEVWVVRPRHLDALAKVLAAKQPVQLHHPLLDEALLELRQAREEALA